MAKDQPQTQPTKQSHFLRNALVTFGVIVVLSIIGLASGNNNSSTTSNQSSTTTNNGSNTNAAPAGKVEVKSHRRSESGAYPSIVGEVINNTQNGVTFVRVTATLYDKDGAVVATGFRFAGTTADTALEPGNTSPFVMVFLDKPTFDSYKLDVTWD